jgi:predicted nucleic acid-binding protein
MRPKHPQPSAIRQQQEENEKKTGAETKARKKSQKNLYIKTVEENRPRKNTPFKPPNSGDYQNAADKRAVVLENLPSDIEANDPFDAFLLAMAVAGKAEYLVTGDHRAGLLQRGHIGHTRIVTPAAFCAEAL